MTSHGHPLWSLPEFWEFVGRCFIHLGVTAAILVIVYYICLWRLPK